MAAVIYNYDSAFDRTVLDGASVAFGVFDGVHLGHRYIIDQAVRTADKDTSRSVVITFDSDPDEVFRAQSLKKLMTNEERIAALADSGVDGVLVLPFSREFAAQSPDEFLLSCFGSGAPRHIHVGCDFRFGSKAAGNVEDLKIWGGLHGMSVHGHSLQLEGGQPITATRIRKALLCGDVSEGEKLLGRPYTLAGTVQAGRGEGRDFGFATANLEIPEMMRAIGEGVYAAYGSFDGRRYKAAVNVGVAATFAESSIANIEVHLLDFDEDIYGKTLSVQFVRRLRSMRVFETTDELIETVMGDIEWVRINL